MADRYWVGGTANWDGTAGTKWALTSGGAGGQAVPTSADDVFFDAASGAVVATITTESGTAAKSINCTGFTGTLASTVVGFPVHGSLTLSATMTATSLSFDIRATGTVTTAGKTLTSLTIAASGGTVTLGGALTVSDALTVTSGTFTTSASNYAVTANQLVANGASVKTITLNASTVTLSSASTLSGAFNYTGSSLTFNAGTSTINLSGTTCRLDAGAGLTFNNVALTSTSTSTTRQIDGVNTFAQLTLAAPASSAVSVYEFHANQTITTLVAAGASAIRRIFLCSDILGTRRTLTVTTWSSITDVDFRDIGMNTSRSGTRLGNAGGNLNITFPAAKTVYWNLAGAQNWSATGWATSSGDSPAINNFPLAQDTAVFDENGAITNITVNSRWNITTVDMSARTSAMTFTCASSNQLLINGNLITGSGVTYAGTSRLVFSGRAPQQITTAGKTVTQVVEIASAGSTVTLQDALTVSVITTGSITLTSGTFDLDGYNVTITGGTFNGSGSIARTLAFGGSTFTVGGTAFTSSVSTNFTVSGSGTVRMTRAEQKSFGSGSADYSGITVDQAGAGLLVFGNAGTLGNISNSYASTGATSIRFDANQTLGDFTASGQAGRVLTITSSINGVARTLTKTSGVVSVNHLNIRDSTATGGADWYAGANSVNTSNNTGWIFDNAPGTGGGGNFLAFFM
jgi:hypothetical protein